MLWKWASASVVGTSHIHNGNRLQDAYAVLDLGDGRIFAVVSDGAGSAEFGSYGAWLTCRFISVRVRAWLRENQKLPTDEELTDWIDELRKRIFTIASQRETTLRQFAATLAALMVTPDEAVTLHIGDSAVVGRKAGGWQVLCWPENGEYASTTYFVTDEPEPRLNIIRHPVEYDAYALFSDGIGELALSYQEHAAYPRFLDPMLHPVEVASGARRLVDLSKTLASYLAGPSVCERTDDDKTLILIAKG